MIDVRKDWKWEFKFVAQLAALVLSVYADGYYLCSGAGELIVVSSQTGQLLSAIRSPVAPVKHQHNFGFACVIFQRDVCSFR